LKTLRIIVLIFFILAMVNNSLHKTTESLIPVLVLAAVGTWVDFKIRRAKRGEKR
jgi:hypothetical protein